MKRDMIKTIALLGILVIIFVSPASAQSLLFRLPYATWENTIFNQSFSGNEGTFRAQYMIGKTGLPTNDIHTFSADGQVYRFGRTHFTENGSLREYKPELFITGGLNMLSYSVNDQYSFGEYTGNIGFRISIPNKRDRVESIGAGYRYQATKQTSSNFLAINVFSTNVRANLFSNAFSFNNDINFNLNTNNFATNSGTVIDQENIWVNGLSGLFFLSIIPPRDNKPDNKPVLYMQLGYRDTFSNPKGVLVDYRSLRVVNTDIHFAWPFGNPDRIQNSLSLTLSYVRIDQNDNARFLTFFDNAAFSQDRLVATLHFQNEKPIGFDAGFEYTLRQHYAVFINLKYRNKYGYFNTLISGGVPTDKFDDVTLRGENNRQNFQLGITYSTISYKRKGLRTKKLNKGKNSSGKKN